MAKPTGTPTLNSGNALGALLTHGWAFSEGTGTTVTDIAPSGAVNGTLAGTATWGTSGAGDPVLSIPSGVGSVTLASTVTTASPWSVAFRAKQANNDTKGMISGKPSAASDYIWLQGGTGFVVRLNNGSATLTGGGTNFTTEANWVVTFNGTSTLTLYKDGSSVGTSATFFSNQTQIADALGSGHSTTSLNLVGTLDYYWIFGGTVLNSGQVSSLHSDPYQVYTGSGGGGGSVGMAAPRRRGRRNSTLLRM